MNLDQFSRKKYSARLLTTLSVVLLVIAGGVIGRAADSPLLSPTLAKPARVRETEVKKAVTASLPLIQNAAASFRKQSGNACFTCHHQSMPVFAMRMAREKGFTVDKEEAERQSEIVLREFTRCCPTVLKALTGETKDAGKAIEQFFPGGAAHIGYGLFGLAAWDKKPDSATESVARYLPQMQEKNGRWRGRCSVRAPSEGSDFTETALSVFALSQFVTPAHTHEVAPALTLAKEWLTNTPAKTTEDKTFRLFGLVWAGLDPKSEAVRKAAAELLATQRGDGGWAQETGYDSDAYATGEALVALHQAGGLTATSDAYQRGLQFLLKTQAKDGSWFVHSRAKPFQVYVETGYPGGTDQFISIAAGCWATAALTLACPKPTTVARQ